MVKKKERTIFNVKQKLKLIAKLDGGVLYFESFCEEYELSDLTDIRQDRTTLPRLFC
jgi:hypothetical protein